MKTLAIFGGTGQTGKLVLETALKEGYKVKALVRSPKKVELANSKLEVIEGDVLSADDVIRTVENADVVLSLFGHVKGSPQWLQTNGTENIVEAMKEAGVKKIISLSGGGLPVPDKDKPKLADKMIRFIMKVAVPKILKDAVLHAAILRKSNLDWMIVRGPRLTNEKPKNEYRVGWVGVNASTKISRADLADFILKQIESDEFVHQMPFVSE
ncbi:NAD dependent epimerase/dehydratase [Marivirga tractuosa]|uniref:NmrA family protein n=1 Tax=Marivirga tractuosa (strain ATCC 23168 / DSM 4126 / NBRC 15989 / NCIMB 1408 / VKM B-1430 / H-43) TaxID=643867 RepID=E4TM45_MARTH|nr:SDR family oxidoreductase [Marivirga tractuosa]ADR21321.1 NmrA family protein [Marivirga tractuosa DSM 4126]BDD14225.1 NAD dependent epimerase/dehydratase [Marivirga tractuosa]